MHKVSLGLLLAAFSVAQLFTAHLCSASTVVGLFSSWEGFNRYRNSAEILEIEIISDKFFEAVPGLPFPEAGMVKAKVVTLHKTTYGHQVNDVLRLLTMDYRSNGARAMVHGAPVFEKGRKMMVFLETVAPGVYQSAGLAEGTLIMKRNASGHEVLTKNTGKGEHEQGPHAVQLGKGKIQARAFTAEADATDFMISKQEFLDLLRSENQP